MSKVTIAFAVLAAMAVAVPASAKTYYVVQDSRTKHCKVSARKPQGSSMIQVGSDTYTTAADAKTAMKAASDCQQ
ncbi:MAG TPA: hypothetical protein VKB67_15025 [Rhizomicrobium sp.]|nr:hypothetical protein [Rhizomicrobium sp.]